MNIAKKEFRIGLAVIAAGVILFFGINYLKGINIFRPANFYYVSFTNVNGLAISAPVTLNGYQVGLVRDMNYEYDNPGHISVELQLDKKLRIPSGSRAVITQDLLGTSTVVLKFSDSGDFHSLGDKIIGENAPSMMDEVSRTVLPAVNSILPQVDTLLANVNRLVGDTALLRTVRRLDAISADLAATTRSLRATTAMLPSTMEGVSGTLNRLDTIAGDLAVVSGELREAPIASTLRNVNDISANLSTVTARLTTPDNTIGKLLNDTKIYDNLESATTTIDSILIDVKNQPRRYILPIKIF